MWTNPEDLPGDTNGDECPGVCNADDDGDGLTDEDSNGCSKNGVDTQGEPCTWANDLINDDDENGFADDIYGTDFINNDGDPADDNGHGTHVSGTTFPATNALASASHPAKPHTPQLAPGKADKTLPILASVSTKNILLAYARPMPNARPKTLNVNAGNKISIIS